ncbi:MAG: transketolase family protein [Candidatus Abyssobacteria bacterium SURF_17]|uniref:Transketolase family protein n=1 Tax=Candidatus Abyssobacteria bacterium SURF_17 TaxID=2093361 RepID=A0A419ESZ6_9BACT|nr:MAG: transketolase family protein [Candidatus Abyssubacteria bacterium SURF_17]
MPKRGEKIATRDAYGDALVRLGERNPNIVVLDADLAKSTKTIKFKKKFPERFFDLGIAEADMMGTAAGLAAAGKVAFASTFAIFATGRAWEQIRNSICYTNLHVTVAASHAGIAVGPDGSSHQSIEDIALMRVIPNMKVVVPADAVETDKAVAALVETPGPAYLRLGRSGVPVIYEEDYEFALGKASVLRDGSDLTIIAIGAMVHAALSAAQALLQEGISARVVNMSTVKPLDRDAILSAVSETGAIVAAEEHSVIGGLGSAVSEVVCELAPAPVIRVGVRDRFGQSGEPGELMAAYGLTASDIVEAAREAVTKKATAK